MKRCTKCDEVKPLSEFHVNSAVKDGRRADCKVCKAAQVFRNAQANHQNQGGKVYLFKCHRTGDTYVGSTTMSLMKRKSCHFAAASSATTNVAGCIRMVPDRSSWTMTVLEYVGDVSTEELREREQLWIEELGPTLNEQAACKAVAA